ncbi:MAG: hypothetical protein ACK2UE_03640 [Anaerolineales bacterium]|jgi:hypothetical protein
MNRISMETGDPTLSSLFRVSGAAALLCALMYVITLVVYVPANLASPPPDAILEWFQVFQDNQVTGLFYLGLGDIVIMILWVPMSLGLYSVLKGTNRTWSLIATAVTLVGVAVYLATNTAFSMLALSQEYAVASTETEKTILLAAGQSMLAVTRGTGSLYTGMQLVWLAGLILSIIMLGSTAFRKASGWVGILGFGLLLVGIIGGANYTSSGEYSAIQGIIVALQYIGGGLLTLAWYILVGIRLWKLGKTEG